MYVCVYIDILKLISSYVGEKYDKKIKDLRVGRVSINTRGIRVSMYKKETNTYNKSTKLDRINNLCLP